MPSSAFTYRRRVALLSAALLLAGCGGGGGEASGPTLQSPPSTAATLSLSSSEALQAVSSVLDGGAAVASQQSGPDSLFVPVGGNAAATSRTLASAREQPMAVHSVSCSTFLASPCSGSVTLDTNVDLNGSSVLPAGSYLAFSFNGLAGTAEGKSYSVNGGFRIDLLTTVDANATAPANARFRTTASALTGTVNGEAFGPRNSVALFEFDAQGVASVTSEGRAFVALSGVTVTDRDNYSIASGRVRKPHWSGADTYVDCTFQTWTVSNGHPAAGSHATLSAGPNSIVIDVTAAAATQVVFDVELTVDGVVKRYTVTADYPVGGGTPVYTVVEITV
jgi:hypothetical protein